MNTAKTAKEAPDVPVAINTHVRQTEAVNFPLFPHIPGGPGDAEKIDNVSGLDGAVMNAIDALKVGSAHNSKQSWHFESILWQLTGQRCFPQICLKLVKVSRSEDF